MFRFSRILYHLGVFSLVFFIWMRPAFSSILSMEYTLGFNGRFQINKWTPITVTVENRGKAVSGKLEVLVTSGSEYHRNVYQATYSLDLDLPYGARKQCSFTVLIESFTHDLIIRFQQEAKTIASQSINLRTHYTQNELAGILIDGIYPEVLPAFPKSLSPVHLHERFLPETWYGYDGVRLLVMEAGKVNRLRQPQLKALERWIRQGGFLVVAGSINAGVLMDRGVQHMLPITVYGLKKFNRLHAFSDFSGQEIVNPNPFLVLHVGIKGSDVLAKEGNIPLVLDRKLGNGKIVFLSFDPHSQPFIRLMSNPGFWKKILMASPKIDPKPMLLPAQRILQVMLASINIDFPGYWFSSLSVFLYLLLFWVCVKKLNNNKWRSVRYLFLTVIFFSLAGTGYFLFSSQKNASYNSFCRINLTGKNANSDGEYIIGLYSTGEEPYDLSFTESSFSMPVRHLISESSTQKIPSPYRIKQAGLYNHIVGLSGKWSYSFYTARPRFEFPVLADVQADAEHLNVMIENKTPYEIVDCLIFYNQRFYEIKDIASESKESRRIAKSMIDLQKVYDPGAPKSMIIRGTGRESTFFNTMKNNLKDDLRSAIHATAETDKNTVYITGWINADILKPSFAQKDITGEGVTLISWKGRL